MTADHAPAPATPAVPSHRASGVLAHITSLPSPFGIGDLGPGSWDFLDYLAASGQAYWQILPTGPTDPLFDNSPYMTRSAFAGSPLLLSPELLREAGLISSSELTELPDFSPFDCDFPLVWKHKARLLRQAGRRFDRQQPAFGEFLEQTAWLKDYCLFMACHESFQTGWHNWPKQLRCRNQEALKAFAKEQAEVIAHYQFEQFEFHRQWRLLLDQAGERGIRLIGDIPIYLALDSADVWANQQLFDLDPDSLLPREVSGVPPDYFSRKGQKWGNPLYKWQSSDPAVQQGLLAWWRQRFTTILSQVDIARIDHFRGFESYWAVPTQAEDARTGQWRPGPGLNFFQQLTRELGPLPIIAEDLGEITAAVHALRQTCAFPGMKVLQFAFDHDPANPFLPQNFQDPNCVVYSGTHDNDTTVGWFLSPELSTPDRSLIKAHCNQEQHDRGAIHLDLIHLAMTSIAWLAIFPLQDILGFGSDCRMNTPGTEQGNWRWRCAPEFLSDESAGQLHHLTTLSNRLLNP